MPYFNESQLEMSIVTLLQEQGYDYVKGEDIVRNLDEVVLRNDLAQYLRSRYKNDGITEQEVEAAIRVITQRMGGSLYEENRHTMNLLMDGFSLKREDATRQNLYIQPIAFEESQQKHNIFKVVNQYDIVGNQHRIPDAIIFLNGLLSRRYTYEPVIFRSSFRSLISLSAPGLHTSRVYSSEGDRTTTLFAIFLTILHSKAICDNKSSSFW